MSAAPPPEPPPASTPAPTPPPPAASPATSPATGPLRRWRARYRQANPTTRGILWACAAGLCFAVLNSVMRLLTQRLDPFQAQFLRYALGLVVLLPFALRMGPGVWRPHRIGLHFTRGAVHTVGLMLWFTALPRIPLADMTAIGFTGPIFIMIGARLLFREPMHWERWLATLGGFAGVLIVVGPRLSGAGGQYHLLMLASAPVFAASFLLTKGLTRVAGNNEILVWQSISVSVFSLPLALWHWQALGPLQWAGFVLCGVLGSAGHWCLTQSFREADISATQSAKFLDLVWSALMGWLLFADVPTGTTLAGGALTAAATLWVARREARRAAPAVAR